MHESSFGRVIGALISPEKTFRSIAERPTWVVPLLLQVLLVIGAGLAMQDRVDQKAMARFQVEKMENIGFKLNQEQIDEMEAQMENQSPTSRIVSLVFGSLGYAVFYVILAAIFLGTFRLTGSELRFKQSLGTIVHAFLPLAVAALLNIPLTLSRPEISPEEMMSGGLLTSSLRPLAPEDSPVLASLLGSLDFFALWSIVLLVIGYRASARVSTPTAATVAVVFWGILILGKACFAAAFN